MRSELCLDGLRKMWSGDSGFNFLEIFRRCAAMALIPLNKDEDTTESQ